MYSHAMDELTSGQRETLRDLARKNAGETIGFINIADARALTELDLAQRSREGWDITPAGLALLADQPKPPASDDLAAR